MNSSDSQIWLSLMLVSLLSLAVFIVYLYTLSGLLREINPENRKISPDQIWLLLVPVYNVFWYTQVLKRLQLSVKEEYHDRGWKTTGSLPGIINGYIAYALLLLSAIEPRILIVALVFGALHWMQINSIKSRLEGFGNIL